MVNVARGARQTEIRAAQFAIHRGSREVPSIGANHFYPEQVFGQGAAKVIAVIMRRWNTWSRTLEAPNFLFGFCIVERLELSCGWGMGPDSEATILGWFLDRRSRNEFE
jgi:hypothetical protein